jgi:hypothetical protein
MPAHIKYPELHDEKWLANELKTKTNSEIARDLGCTPSLVSLQKTHFKIKAQLTHSQAVSKGLGGVNKKKDRWGHPHIHNGYWKYYDWDKNGKRKEYAVHDLKYAQQELGYHLPRNWVVHHINGKKLDNELENLYGCSNGEHGTLKYANVLETALAIAQMQLEDFDKQVKNLTQQNEKLNEENRKLRYRWI